jgi:hypothetical protein
VICNDQNEDRGAHKVGKQGKGVILNHFLRLVVRTWAREVPNRRVGYKYIFRMQIDGSFGRVPQGAEKKSLANFNPKLTRGHQKKNCPNLTNSTAGTARAGSSLWQHLYIGHSEKLWKDFCVRNFWFRPVTLERHIFQYRAHGDPILEVFHPMSPS